MLGSSRVAAQLAASQEGLSSMSEWWHCSYFCSSMSACNVAGTPWRLGASLLTGEGGSVNRQIVIHIVHCTLQFPSEVSLTYVTFVLTFSVPPLKSRDIVVGIATGYGLDGRGVGVRVPAGSTIFSSPRRPDRLWGPPSLLSNGYRGLFSLE
jgi:hypothetical protein